MDFEGAKKYIEERLRNELPESFSYHSYAHVQDVYRVADQLAGLEGIDGEGRILLLIAVLFHDSGFLTNPRDHEVASCILAKEHLPRFGFSPEQLEVICSMIMATRLPQSPKNRLEEVICDADLDYLGRDDFWSTGQKLFAEMKMNGLVHDVRDWNEMQVRFLETHHYFTESAKTLRNAKKLVHLGEVKSLLAN
jgi:uncharacterized protein